MVDIKAGAAFSASTPSALCSARGGGGARLQAQLRMHTQQQTQLHIHLHDEHSHQLHHAAGRTAQQEAIIDHDDRSSSSSSLQPPPALTRKPRSDPFSLIAADLCNKLQSLIDPTAVTPAAADHPHLTSNFAPLPRESPPTPCPLIEGSIPASLNGVFLRNGPNPLYPTHSAYHYFDGDAMLHAVTICNGHAIHACRYIRTNRFLYEQAAQQPLFVRPMGELHGLKGIAKLCILHLRHMLGIINLSKGYGSANAGLVYFNGKVLAMSEDDQPYWVHLSKDGDIHTVGRFDFHGKLKSNSMTAHPKVDPSTQELLSFSYNLLLPPYLKYFRVTSNGEKLEDVSITLKEPTIMHDFAITQNYAIFYEHQVVFKLHEMLLKGGSPIAIDTKKRPRVGIIHRNATTEADMQWFECLTSFGTCMHIVNAWEEGDEVVMVACVSQQLELMFKDIAGIQCRLTEFRFNLRTGRSKSDYVSHANIEMGKINDTYFGKKTRFVYLCTYGPWPKYSGVCKIDLQAPRRKLHQQATIDSTSTNNFGDEPCIVGLRTFGENYYVSEPSFVPKSLAPSLKEDDGYLVTFLHDEVSNCTKLVIMDAQSPNLTIVATVTLPTRVPYGFHSLFVAASRLREQADATII